MFIIRQYCIHWWVMMTKCPNQPSLNMPFKWKPKNLFFISALQYYYAFLRIRFPNPVSVSKVDRVVTPKLGTLPSYLIIRNNSLIAEDVKRRMHVVYPDKLDLSGHTLDGRPAQYMLSGVVFHHGHWVKHYSGELCLELLFSITFFEDIFLCL